MSVNFNIPFNALCQGMQVMHRSGFSVTALNTNYVNSEIGNQTSIKDEGLKTEDSSALSLKTSSYKSSKLKAESKTESAKRDKKNSQKNRRQRRK